MLNWMNPQWQAQHPGNPWAAYFGGGGAAAPAQAPITNPMDMFAAGNTTSPFIYEEPASNAKKGKLGFTPQTGVYKPNPNYRQQLAQIIAQPQPQPWYGRGPAWGSGAGNGPNYGGREGRAGTIGWGGGSMANQGGWGGVGMGGWGRGPGSSPGWGNRSEGGMGGRGSFF